MRFRNVGARSGLETQHIAARWDAGFQDLTLSLDNLAVTALGRGRQPIGHTARSTMQNRLTECPELLDHYNPTFSAQNEWRMSAAEGFERISSDRWKLPLVFTPWAARIAGCFDC